MTLGVGSFILQAALLVGLVLLLIRRWGVALPAGWLTFLLGFSTAGLSLFHWTPWTLPVALLGGAAGDVLYRWLRPATEAPLRLRGFATVLPAILFSLYFAALFVQGGVWWAIHVWLGAIALSAITSWLVTYLVLPPTMPEPR
jgi:hypothetical protein